MEEYISSIASTTGVAVCIANGNEAIAKHHFFTRLKENENTETMEIRVAENEYGFSVAIWSFASDKISISIQSPLGESINKIEPQQSLYYTEIKLVLENTAITIEYLTPASRGSDRYIEVKFRTPTPGIWTINLIGEAVLSGNIHAWLPISQFISEGTYFLTPDPEFTVTVPATADIAISVGGYNSTDGGVYPSSGRGPTRLNYLKPLMVAPAVNIKGANGAFTGTSAASAIATGAAALLLEWGIVRENAYGISTQSMTYYFINGAVRDENIVYPNNIWGYGKLNLYNTFRNI